jgi:hypothetical protein
MLESTVDEMRFSVIGGCLFPATKEMLAVLCGYKNLLDQEVMV